MQARENTVKTVGMYKETMKLLLRCTNKKYRAVQTTRYLKSYWVS